ncbi:MAG: ATP-binding protein [Alphaproteobacteria bacterium]|nr:ATP-binding protein [Alphaproteobacteria bacterium]
MHFFKKYKAPLFFTLLLAGALVMLGAFVYKGTGSINRAMSGIEQSHEIISKNQELAAQVERMAAQQQAYVLSGEDRFNAAYDFTKGNISNRIAELTALMRQNTAQVSRLNELQHHFLLLSERLDEMAMVYRADRALAAIAAQEAARVAAEKAAAAEAANEKTPDAAAPKSDKKPKPAAAKEVRLVFNLPLPPPRPMPTMDTIEAARENLSRVSGEIIADEQLLLKRRSETLEQQRRFYRLSVMAGAVGIALVFLVGVVYLVRAPQAPRADAEGGAEEMFRLAIEGSNDGIFEWYLERETAFYSAQFWAMLGHEKGHFPETMQSFRDILHPEDRERVLGHLERYLGGELPDYLIIFRMRHKSGRWVWINGRGKALYDDKGKPYRLVGAHTDISHIKAYEEKLQKAKETAEKASRAKTDFLAHMSHEIRTPLTAISGIAEIFEKHQGNLDPKQQQLVKTLNSSTQSLKELVSDILDFSKIESGELELEESPFGLQNLFEQVVSIVSVKAHEKGIGFRFDFEDVKRQRILGDRARLRQILINLIGNAVKFTDKGEVEIKASRIMKGGSAQLRIDVRDTGIGIDPKHFDMIFERFKQADSSVSRKYGGTGLGLPISQRLARLMGGNITVDSALGKGSTFTLLLPVRQEEEITEAQSDQSLSLSLSESIREQGKAQKRILLVEDYEGNVVLLSYLLDSLGCQYDVARTGLEAVNMWKQRGYDLILMDVQMPEMDGFTATAQIRRMEEEKALPRTPIIGMTAHALVGDKEKCIEAGMDSYLPKPIVEIDLKSKIVEYLDAKKRVA